MVALYSWFNHENTLFILETVHFGHLSYCMYYCWDWHHYKEVGLGIKTQSYEQIGWKQTSNFVSYLEDDGINLLPKLCVVKIHHRLSLCEEKSCVFPFMYIYIFLNMILLLQSWLCFPILDAQLLSFHENLGNWSMMSQDRGLLETSSQPNSSQPRTPGPKRSLGAKTFPHKIIVTTGMRSDVWIRSASRIPRHRIMRHKIT